MILSRNKRSQAEAALAKGQPEKAAKLLEKWLAAEPADLKVRRQLADLYRDLGDPQNAIVHFEALAGGHAAAGLLLRAISACKSILELDPNHTETQHALAELYAKKRGGVANKASLPPMMTAALRSPPPLPEEDGEHELDDEDILVTAGDVQLAPDVTGPALELGEESLAQVIVPQDTLPVQPAEVLEVADAEVEVMEEVLDLGDDVSLGGLDENRSDGDLLDVADIHLSLEDDASIDIDFDSVSIELEEQDGGGASLSSDGLPESPLFSELSRGAFEALLTHLDLVRVPAGQVIVREGEPGDSFFVISRGQVRVERQAPAPHQIGLLDEGAFFGEIAIVAEVPRSASVIAERSCDLLEIRRDALEAVAADHPSITRVLRKFCRERLLNNLVQTSPLLKGMDDATRAEMVTAFKPTSADAGEDVIREGETNKALFLILSGEVEIRSGGARRSQLRAGDVFGEMGLFFDEPAAATVRALRPCQLLRLSAKAFDKFCGRHPDVKARLEQIGIQRAAENEADDDLMNPNPTV